MTENELTETVLTALRARRSIEFAHGGERYRIQTDNNKGCDYLSLWRTEPRPARLGEAMYDVMFGADEDAVRELLSLRCVHGACVLDLGGLRWL